MRKLFYIANSYCPKYTESFNYIFATKCHCEVKNYDYDEGQLLWFKRWQNEQHRHVLTFINEYEVHCCYCNKRIYTGKPLTKNDIFLEMNKGVTNGTGH